jgi:hypothetical protein
MDHLLPRQVGDEPGPPPRRVRARDRELIEWVAAAAPGDRVPEPWRWAKSPTRSVLLILAGLGVIETPQPGADVAALVRDAAVSARAWLDAHPPDV